MRFVYPLAFIGLLAIPAIIAMYLLKRKYQEIPVSSTLLWRKAFTQSYAQQPWQRLRKNILMILQLLAAACIIFALAGPFFAGKGEVEHYIFVLDGSYGMQAADVPPSRFEKGREEIERIVQGAPAGTIFSLIMADHEPYIAVNGSADKTVVRNRLESLTVSNAAANAERTVNLVQTLYEQNPGAVYVFSHQGFDFGEMHVNHMPVGSLADNMAITLMSHSVDGDRVIVLIKVRNYGRSPVQNTVALYTDELLYDTRNIRVEAGGEADVFFTDVPYGVAKLTAGLLEEDALAIDNTYYDVVNYGRTERVLLFTEQNVFLENVLALLPNVEVYRGSSNEMDGLEGAYLYVFDGVLPEILPEDGHILVFNPPVDNTFIETSEAEEIDAVFVNASPMLNFIQEMEFGILRSKIIETPAWGDVVLSSDKTPLIIAGEIQGRKAVVIGFDLHDTDLPLKKEFPIFMYNLAQWFVPGSVLSGERIYTGEAASFNISPDATAARVIGPQGITEIAPPFPADKFSGTAGPGFYILAQTIQETEVYTDFPVNLDTAAGSDLSMGYLYTSEGGSAVFSVQRNYHLDKILLVLALIFLCAEWYFLWKGKLKLPDLVRIVLIFLLCLSLTDINFKRYANDTYTVFAVDLSASVEGAQEQIVNFINGANKNKTDQDSVGVVAFGKNAVIEHMPTTEPAALSLSSYVDTGFTNIADGLVLAQSMIPENARKRVVLISDGNENMGDGMSVAKMFREQNIELDVYYIENKLTEEVQLTKINVPQNLNKNVSYSIEVVAHSLSDNAGRIVLYKNGNIFTTQDVTLNKGENRFIFNDISDVGGSVIYRAEILPQRDTIYANNNAYAYSYVADIPNLLVVGLDGSGGEIEKILESAQVNVAAMSPYELPVDMEQISLYDGIILADISADDLPEGFMEGLDAYVKSGGGVVATGGENSYALGGYYGTPLAELLPVDMELKDQSNLPNLGMIVVIDRSGSMSSGRYGLSKMELAKEAVIRSVDSLTPSDMLGVLAFDDAFHWVADFGTVGDNGEGIKDQIASITLGGGTSILPALQEAYKTIAGADTKLKHIILLTDGQAERSGYETLLDSMNSQGITLSTVAVGSDSDTFLLEYLAATAGGRYYYTDEFTDLPKIFTKETFLAGKTYLNHVDFYPEVGYSNALLEGIEALPELHGYVATTPKPRADIVLYGPEEAPILASWQYGLGRSVAFTSDMAGQWSSALLSSDEGVQLFRNMVSWVIRQQMSGDISAEGQIIGENSEITVFVPYDEGIEGIQGKVIAPNMAEADVAFAAYAPGVYKGTVPFNEEGAYIASLQLNKNGGTEGIVTGINIPYAQEYDIAHLFSGADFLNRLAAASGGRVLAEFDDIFTPLSQQVYTTINITPWILVLALLWLLFDIAYHRFPSLKRKIHGIKLRDRIKKTPEIVDFILDDKMEKQDVLHGNQGKEKAKASGAVQQKAHGQAEAKKNTTSTLLTSKKKRTGR